jgi:uncharacterized protein YqeY
MKNLIPALCSLTLLIACGPQERVSKEVIQEVNKNMEVKRLTESEILQEAMIWGDSISMEAQNQLIKNLQTAIASQGIEGAVEFCNSNALPILKEVSEKNQVTIKRVSNRNRNPLDKPDQEESGILEAYEYNSEQGKTSDPNIQKINGGEVFLYTKAIVIPGGFCLSCHGEPGKDVSSETLSKITSLYPEDKALNHKIGDLRGMWSIRIPKKEVVKRL